MEPKSNDFLESLIQSLSSAKDKSVCDTDDPVLLDSSTVCYTERPVFLSLEEKEKEILCYSHSQLKNVAEERLLPNDKDIINDEICPLADASPTASASASASASACDICNMEEQQQITHLLLEEQDQKLIMGSNNELDINNNVLNAYISHRPLPLGSLGPLPLLVRSLPDEEGLELPARFRFSPSDKELLLHYLANRLTGRDLPSNAVKDFDVYTKEPWLLPGVNMMGNKKCVYFFVPWRKTSKDSSRTERSAGKGFWRASTGDKAIMDNKKKLIGYAKQLTYHICNHNNKESNNKSKKTDWIMHEYKLTKSPDMTLCRIKYNKTSSSTKTGHAK